MPYITRKRRDDLGYFCEGEYPQNAGELNYVITEIIHDYLARDKESYQKINDVMGALEGAKLEFYRRKVVPYEDQKIKDNGDIY